MSEAAIDAAKFRHVLGNYPTGVSVITALDPGGAPVGMVVGTFTSVSLDPPLVGFLPDKRSSSWPQIEAAGQFGVSVFASDQVDLCKQLTKSGPGKFAGVDFAISGNGVPMLSQAMVTIECRLHGVAEAGDHWFVTGRVLAMNVHREADPMLFLRGRYGGFAEIA